MTPSFIACVFAFALGSIPFGLLIARVYGGKDLRKQGSGNIGATNVSRVLGFWPAGFLTFVLDAAKGSVPILLASPIGSRFWMEWVGDSGHLLSERSLWSVGLLAVLGHCFSPWLKFKGGKGVATGLGAIAILSPWSAVAGLLGFVLTFVSTKTGSIASLGGLTIAAVTHLVMNPVGPHLWAGAAMVGVILVRHEANLTALLEGKEARFE